MSTKIPPIPIFTPPTGISYVYVSMYDSKSAIYQELVDGSSDQFSSSWLIHFQVA